jgi:methionine biosynthesis protein MetW
MATPDDNAIGLTDDAVPALRYDVHSWADPREVSGVMRSFLPDGARVLDVGCGTGSLTGVVTNGKNAQVFGIEPDSIRAGVAESRGFEVYRGTLAEDYFRGREAFDVIILADVLEHVSDPASLLRLAAGGIKPGGILLISVPNVAHWSMRLHVLLGRFDYTETGIRDATHLRWFTLRSIRDLLNRQGFEILRYEPAAGSWMPEYRKMPWTIIPYRFRGRMISRLAALIPTLFACQHVLKVRPVKPVRGGPSSRSED